jgi:hypothetical protein
MKRQHKESIKNLDLISNELMKRREQHMINDMDINIAPFSR